MLIRIPSLLDLIKVAAIVLPDNDAEQAEFVTRWHQEQTSLQFVSYVAIDKKKIVGWLTGTVQDNESLQIGFFKGETAEVLEKIWKKVQKDLQIRQAQLMTNDPDVFLALGFEPQIITMTYERSAEQSGA